MKKPAGNGRGIGAGGAGGGGGGGGGLLFTVVCGWKLSQQLGHLRYYHIFLN